MNNRVCWVDNWKGFMLLVVCLQHCYVPIPGMIYLTSMHVASFFFLSGFLYHPKKDTPFTVFAKRKVRHLVIPYISLSFLFLLLEPRIFDIDIPLYEDEHFVLRQLLNHSDPFNVSNAFDLIALHIENIVLEGVSSITTGPLWFLWCLFGANMILWVITRISCHRKYTILFMIILLCIGWLMNMASCKLPFNLNTIVTASSIVLLGYLSQPIITKFNIRGGVENHTLYHDNSSNTICIIRMWT